MVEGINVEDIFLVLSFIISWTFRILAHEEEYYSLSDGGGWSKMTVSFSVSSQSILDQFS